MVQLYICSNSIHTYACALYVICHIWSTHQGFLKGPIGQWMTYLTVDHVTYSNSVRCTAVTIYTNTHSTQCVNSLVYIPSPPVGQFSASTTVRANRETERPLAPDGGGRERGGVTLVGNSEGGADLGWSEYMSVELQGDIEGSCERWYTNTGRNLQEPAPTDYTCTVVWRKLLPRAQSTMLKFRENTSQIVTKICFRHFGLLRKPSSVNN